MQQPMRSAKGSANWEDTSSAVYEVMKEKSTTEKTEWPTIEEQQAYWRTKEADLSLDKVEATTDYIDHFLAGNPTSERPFSANETEDSFDNPFCNYLSAVPVLAEPEAYDVAKPQNYVGEARESKKPEQAGIPAGSEIKPDSHGGAQNSRLSLENRKAPSASTLAEQKWAEPEWTLRDEIGESYREIP